jgi:lipopolysaccharide/colanic/teichoic acid biosynthesis glycosyltransferase
MKRAFDILASATGLLVLSPVMLATAALVARRMGRPVLFRQVRPGLRGRPFEVLKFRTMSNAVGSNGELLSDAQRLTKLGSLLRRLSLDELPQLWNVLRGDMSVVGPRPLRMEYLPLYSPRQARRHDVRPGITGWAQVNGRNAITWEQKFEQDVWYVENQSFLLDCKIILLTLRKVVTSEGVSPEGQATMDWFRGSPPEDKPMEAKADPC